MRRIAALLLVVTLSAARAHGDEPAPLVQNGDFAAWDGAAPRGWLVSEGARTGTGQVSKIAKAPEGGVRLEGDEKTGAWKMLGQAVTLAAGGTYRLSFEARFEGGPLAE